MKGDRERGEDGGDLKHVVRKVVFQLHEDFKPNATRGILYTIYSRKFGWKLNLVV